MYRLNTLFGMIKVLRFVIVAISIIASINLWSQQNVNADKNCPGIPGACGFPTTSTQNQRSGPGNQQPQNGNGTLGVIYNQMRCGLNYTSASQRLGKRFTPAGVNQPAPFPISGIPACAIIERAYLWAEGSGNGMAQTATVNGPAGSFNFPMAIVGQGPDKCWGYSGSYTYRADVTAAISGNGTYNVSGILTNPPTFGNDMDGATLIVIWSQPSATWQGRIVIADGAIVVNGGVANFNMPISPAVCGPTTNGSAFFCVGDIQFNPSSWSANGTAAPLTWNWWNYNQVNTNFANSQATCNFNVNTNGDCFNLCVAGAYWRSTTCMTCPAASALTITPSSSPASCSNCNGSASVSVSGGTAPYTYSWAPSGGNAATATNLCAGTYTVTVTDACANVGTVAITVSSSGGGLTIGGTQTNILCNGQCTGSANTTVTGGTAPYTYSWAPSGGNAATATGLCPGTYTVTVTDANGCTGNRILTITQPPALTSTGTQTNVLCNGGLTGSAAVTASGGTAPYTYSWAPSGGTGSTATGLGAGTYTVTVTDANGCATTRTYSITQPPTLTATQTQTNILCNGLCTGTAAVTPSGGTAPYSYSWAPSGGTASSTTGRCAGTYTVTITDANGCTATRTFNITQPPAITTTGTQTNVLCNGALTGSAAVTPSGGSAPYTYTWAPSGGTGSTATGLGAGTYTVTVTDATGCTTTRTYSITQPAAITTTGTQTNVFCNGGLTGSASVTPSGGSAPYTYSWAPTGGTGSTATGLGAGTYTVTVTDANGCSTTASATVTEPPQLTVAVTTTPSTCGNANGSAVATETGGTGPYTYLWTPNNTTSATLSNVVAGSYQITVTDANNCTASAIATVNNMGNPVATIVASDSVSCFGGNDGFAAAGASSGMGPYTFTWSNADTDSLAGGLTAGSYTVTVTDANGCADTASVTIHEPLQLTSTTNQVDVLCFGNSTGSATVITSGGTGAYSYSWAPAGGNTDTASALPAGSYTCTITDANGCSTNASVIITEPPQLTATATSTDVSCFAGTDGTATATETGGTAPYSYSWAPTGGNSASASGIAAGTYTCTITDANGCTTTASITITEPTPISITTSAIDANCNQADGSATAAATGGTGTFTYSWLPSGSGSAINNVVTGTYTVIATDANGCADTTTVVVGNLNGVNATLAASANISCFGGADGSIDIDATGGTGPYSYNWLPNVSASDLASGIPAGSYQITVTDANGCTSLVNVTLTQAPALSITATVMPSVVCEGTPVTLSATPAGGTPAYTVTWNPGNLSGNNQTITPTQSGAYTADVTDANGCTASTVVNITVNPVPTANLSTDITSGCAPLCVNFSDLSSALAPVAITGWLWDFGDGNTSNQQNPSHCFDDPGNYTVTLNVTTGAGCSANITMANYISVFANPVAAFGASPQSTTILNPTIFFTDSSSNAVQWNWSFGDLANSASSNQNPQFTYPDPSCYSVLLTVTSADECIDTASQIVCIDPDVSIYVPNTFTPNEDGRNDVFFPAAIGIDPNHFEMWIFDRWGNMIFYTNDINDGWDGHVQGASDIAQIDTFVWKIKAKDILGKKHDLIGHVNLIK